jgi:hypothetical protein
MKKFFVMLVAILLTLPVYSYAQITFETTYGDTGYDVGSSVQQTEDGGYIIAGETSLYFTPTKVYLVKTNSLGVMMWSETYGGQDHDFGYSVQQTDDGGYIIAGTTRSFGSGFADVYLIKTNTTGDSIWAKNYGGNGADGGSSVQQTEDGGYVIAGSTDSFGPDSMNVYLVKTNSTGDTVWTRTYGGDNKDYGYSVQQTNDEGYIVAGRTNSFGPDSTNVYLIKTDSLGNMTWSETYGGDGSDRGSSVQQTEDGGYIIAGSSSSFSPDSMKVYLIKTDSAGVMLWSEIYSDQAYNAGSSVNQTTDGGYIISGSTGAFFGSDAYLVKTDSLGVVMWTQTYGGDYADYGFSVQQTKDKGYIITGLEGYPGPNGGDVYLIKTDSLGIVYPSGINGDDRKFSLKIPKSFALSQNYPNPFNPSTTIAFDIPGAAGVSQSVSLAIYDLRGRRVKELVNSNIEPGCHAIHWNGHNDQGKPVASGIYLYRLKAGGESLTRKMIVAK